MGHMDIEELRDQTIADLAQKHAAAIRKNVLTSHQQTLHDLANDIGERLSENGMLELLIQASEKCGPLAVGAMFTDLLRRAINADAELEAIKEVERMEAAGKAERFDRQLAGALAYMMAGAH